ncbi:CpaF family protein [Thermoanaerobacterium thermosaccharolyticum]|uniref:Type II secretion system protein E n=1 Tax=Thermoanaerobacterium thermosaccharolyticum (strain ATCC 7956 / DSM 571 / NCIMB 9385 / NCA 3814 / NCTC 13789 / WDCM 00135 / 2032) TaxID=580327 RepID=D9TQ69_THETC|nr:ATPase, T2SS/T4P/T4SS family [Thermoanaerobacterium thermosaccharolyticum]ADL67856.1 type II secretion system protein E [Thermoanaerobacterium thermosaccharolyticum DSM 571]KAA5806895.1 CpaF family protein [Thermoanaerobacterium thermosaccharolyticum]TCW42578.1 pilus assembly protein CpaF [Thermohydrogenium kirishiense]
MALIDPFVPDDVMKYDVNANFSVEDACEEITAEVVEKYPKLVAEIENGVSSRTILENKIREIVVDKKIYQGSIEVFMQKIFDVLFGYGPLQTYIDDPEVSDILVNSFNTVYIKKFGQKSLVPVNFGSEEKLTKYCYKIAAMCGGKLDENSNAEAVITDRKRNLRIVISLKPINVISPSIAIRKPTTGFNIDELVEKGMFTADEKELFKSAVKDRKTIVIAGKGGSGKTTLLGALINEIPYDERGLLIQETFEIKPKHPDVICKLVRISDNSEVKDYTLFELTKLGLLMSMDRIFIGEIKDREAMDFFNAVFTGHRGSMATVHANSAKEVVDRLILLMKRSGTDVPIEDLRQMLFSCLDMIVFMEDYRVKEILDLKGGSTA